MLLLIPLLPLFGFAANAGFGRRVSKPVAAGVACAAMVGSFVVSAIAVSQLAARAPESRALAQVVFTWFTSGDFSVGFTLRLDPLSSVMILAISGIGSLIHIYSTAYMHEETDSEFARYFSYLNLFAAFMLLLVLGANFLVMFIGWEGVGICSYLLIGFWYQKTSAAAAGKKAFILNRIGDCAFVLAVLLIVVRVGSVDFQTVAQSAFGLEPETAFGPVSLITLLLFIAAAAKSAQIPLHVWLPDAVDGPTPVSALIHSATMVTAGVYLIGRNAVLFSHAPQTLSIVAIAGVATALMAATIGLVQNDMQRVLAYSTVSQLGYGFLAMGVGAYGAAVFHLCTHAFSKALLFLGSGAAIHALAGERDLRRMGGLRKELPITYWTVLIGALAITGVPFLSGFFSKDEILYRTYSSGHTILWVTGVLTSLLTAIYIFRLVFLAFHGERAEHSGTEYPGPEHPGTVAPGTVAPDHGHDTNVGHHLHDAPPAMALALIVLAIGSVAAGYVGLPAALGGSDWLGDYLEPSFTIEGVQAEAERAPVEGEEHSESLELGLMGVSTAAALGGISLAVLLFLKRKETAQAIAGRFPGVHRLLLRQYYVDEIYDAAVVQPIRIVSDEGLWKVVDLQVIDGVVNGVGEVVRGSSEGLRRIQTGSVRAYAASVFFGVVAILGYYLWR